MTTTRRDSNSSNAHGPQFGGDGGGNGNGNGSGGSVTHRLMDVARRYVHRSFQPGESSQCANFVRHVFKEAGINLPVARRPSDMHLLSPGDGQGPSFANSLAGSEIGPTVPVSQARPGDIVLYANSIPGYRPGVITHVGICSGNRSIIHRPTAAKPVCEADIDIFRIAEIRRPAALAAAASSGGDVRLKVFYHDGKVQAYKAGQPIGHMSVKIDVGGQLSVFVDGHRISLKALRLEIVD